MAKKWSTKSAMKSLKKYMGGFKQSKFKSQKTYSSFWMEDSWSDKSVRFAGYDTSLRHTESSDMVKTIKLASYQRAIANFVKIVAKQDIPVTFGGDNSYTNGKRVNISTDIGDKNFDVAVGLALHEASHIKLTSFEALTNYLQALNIDNGTEKARTLKTLTNIIEDRRIDNYIFKTSPGYKAYYHKMYDHYFDSPDITKALLSSDMSDATNLTHYLFRIANFTNTATRLDAMPGLREIYQMIDIKNIGRLQSTAEVIELAQAVYDKICALQNEAQNSQNQSQNGNQGQAGGSGDDKGDDGQSGGDDVPSSVDITMQSDSGNAGGSGVEITLSPSDMMRVQKAWDKQKDFLDGNVKKKLGTKKLQDQLKKVSDTGVEVQMAGDVNMGTYQTLIYDFSDRLISYQLLSLAKQYSKMFDSVPLGARSTDPELKNMRSRIEEITGKTISYHGRYWRGLSNDDINMPDFIDTESSRYGSAITKGLELGAVLGRKLMLRNEERELVVNRLESGHIDNKRLAHAGYGVENIFKQIHIDKYKKSNLHISLDMSGSMNGSRWSNAIQMTSAIVKAATYVQNLDIQVSARTTQGGRGKDYAITVIIYDSRKNTLKQYIDWASSIHPTNTTPEGLCFDAMIKRGKFVPSSPQVDSYFLNMSDGEPGMSGLSSEQGVRITASSIQKMRAMGINILSFFIHDKTGGYSNETFKRMYGKDARTVSADSVVDIARELNKKFLTEGVVHC